MVTQLVAMADREDRHFRLSTSNDNYKQKWTEIVIVVATESSEEEVEIVPIKDGELDCHDGGEFRKRVKDILKSRVNLTGANVPDWLTKKWVRDAFVVFSDTVVMFFELP